MSKSEWAHGFSETEQSYLEKYKAAWEWRRLGVVNDAGMIQRWKCAPDPCEVLASRDPGRETP